MIKELCEKNLARRRKLERVLLLLIFASAVTIIFSFAVLVLGQDVFAALFAKLFFPL